MRYLSNKIFVLAIWLFSCSHGFAQQKPALDTSLLIKRGNAMENMWPSASGAFLSPKGSYAVYTITDPVKKTKTLIVKSLAGPWEREYINGSQCDFSANERAAYIRADDTLYAIHPGTNAKDKPVAISSYSNNAYNRAPTWAGYLGRKNDKLTLIDLKTGKERELDNVTGFRFNNVADKQVLLVKTDGLEHPITTIGLLDLISEQVKTLWTGKPDIAVADYGFSQSGKQIWFVARDAQNYRSYWCCQANSKRARQCFSDTDDRIPRGFKVISDLNMSENLTGNGRWLLIPLEPRRSVERPKSNADRRLSILSYKDIDLHLPQTGERPQPKAEMAAVSIDGKVFRIIAGIGGFELGYDISIPGISGDEVFVVNKDSSRWEKLGGPFIFPESGYLFSLDDGSMNQIYQNASHAQLRYFTFSPDGKWLVYFDNLKRNWFSYHITAKTTRNLTGNIPVSFSKDFGDTTDEDNNRAALMAGAPAGWLNNKVLLYDNYDLWAIDVAGIDPPKNLTKGYGTAHHINLRIINSLPDDQVRQANYKTGDTLYFAGVNPNNKENGIFSTIIGEITPVKLLTMGPYLFCKTSSQADGFDFDSGEPPCKAPYANRWIVERQTASEYPNYFVTDDWKVFKPLTDLHPQKGYNWLTDELVNYKQLDGSPGQGVLYKPENFDPTKKYPVIVYYYEQFSQRLYEFPRPALTSNEINIPWFVSHGYMVFMPDIHYKNAAETNITYGESAFNAVEAAAIYLATLPYINDRSIGLQGHSFGAFETNYIIAHSHRFAAAEEFAGASDIVSDYLALLPGVSDPVESTDGFAMAMYENEQNRFYATLWQRPGLYLRESAVFHADSITTPMLLVHGEEDNAVPWRQGQELFSALRRLRKPAWLLLYEKEGHNLIDDREEIDHTVRLTQFFDHLLKGYPPPAWMTKDSERRANDTWDSYVLDPKDSCSPDCPICLKKDYTEYYKMKEDTNNEKIN